jgi:aminobenzoyl-glutamate utilization protein B
MIRKSDSDTWPRLVTLAFTVAVALSGGGVVARELSSTERAGILALVEANTAQTNAGAKQIWEWAEVGFREEKSSTLLQEQLRAAGFSVKANVAGMPTAFLAGFRNGSGKGSVIALLAEFDALPGQSQTISASREPIVGQPAGHACGHNLLGAGAVSAAIAVKQWMLRQQVQGEIRVYGSPAEEGGSGKVYMVREGLFDDVDAVLHWHPNDTNSASQSRSLSNLSGKFRFRGRAAHAARSPEQGRSALDAVEAMNFMVNALREHVPSDTRIHYAITNGGESPNVVPEFAEAYYYVRHVDPRVARDVMERLQQAAAGAAMGTGTNYEFEMMGAVYSLLPNDTLGKLADAQLRSMPTRPLDERTRSFAVQLARSSSQPDSVPDEESILRSINTVHAYSVDELAYVSTDVGDISWVVPTAGLRTATWPLGTPAHSWQATAASGAQIGFEGMRVAAGSLALSAAALLVDNAAIARARKELLGRRGPGFKYRALLGDRAPALDYRGK